MENKNNNRGLLVVIIILAIALIGIGSYIMYSSSNSKNEENKAEVKSDDNVVSDKNLTSLEQTKLLDMIKDINKYNLGMYDDLDLSKVSNQEKLAFVSFIVYNNKLNGENGSIVGLSGKKVIEIYQSYFGKNNSITNEDVKMGNTTDSEVLFKYNKDKDVYEIGKEAWKNLYFAPMSYLITTPSTFFVEGSKTNNTYTLKVKSLFETPCSGVCGAKVIAGSYKDANDMKKIEGTDSWYDKDGNLIKEKITDADYEQVKDKISTYTYTFILENGNYIFQSKTISK